jgi:hypothetical protein
LPESREFSGSHVAFGIFCETINEDCPHIGPVCDQRPIAAGSSLARSRHTLLDDTTTEIGVDYTAFGARDRSTQRGIIDLLLAGKPREVLRLEDPHAVSPRAEDRDMYHLVIDIKLLTSSRP